jgi:HAMP domain-containing protein
MLEPGAEAFSYAVLRVVPDLARGERFNAGVVLFCRRRGFLGVRWRLDPARLAALAPAADPNLAAALESELDLRARVAAGDAGAGPLAQLPPADRFGWLVAPTSTMIQPSEVHTGLCADPGEQLEVLFRQLVPPR